MDLKILTKLNKNSGYVTVEAAIAIIVLISFFYLLFLALMLGVGQIRCVDTAREIARLLARGDIARAEFLTKHQLPNRAVSRSEMNSDFVTVFIDWRPKWLVNITFHTKMIAACEPELDNV